MACKRRDRGGLCGSSRVLRVGASEVDRSDEATGATSRPGPSGSGVGRGTDGRRDTHSRSRTGEDPRVEVVRRSSPACRCERPVGDDLVIPQGVEIYVATEPVDMRFGFERLSGLVRERMKREPRSRALFVFFGKRRQTVKVLTWDGTGVVLVYKKLDAGLFEVPIATRPNEQSVVVSDAMFEALFAGLTRTMH